VLTLTQPYNDERELDEGQEDGVGFIVACAHPTSPTPPRKATRQHDRRRSAPDHATAAALRDELAKDPHVLACFISPSGRGVKAFFRVALPDGDALAAHNVAFDSVAKYCKDVYGQTIDRQGKNINRCCSLSHDPEAHYNPAAVPLPVPTAAPEPATHTAATPSHEPANAADAPQAGDDQLALDAVSHTGTTDLQISQNFANRYHGQILFYPSRGGFFVGFPHGAQSLILGGFAWCRGSRFGSTGLAASGFASRNARYLYPRRLQKPRHGHAINANGRHIPRGSGNGHSLACMSRESGVSGKSRKSNVSRNGFAGSHAREAVP